jgi:hypothetical protein
MDQVEVGGTGNYLGDNAAAHNGTHPFLEMG